MSTGTVGQRVVLVVVGSILLVVAFIFATGSATRSLFQDAMVRHLAEQVDLAECRASPATFGGAIGTGFSVYAYSPEGHSENPDATALGTYAFVQVAGVGDTYHHIAADGAVNRGVIRVAESGPCAVLGMGLRAPTRDTFLTLLTYTVTSVLVAMLLAIGAAVVFVVRPLQARIARVAEDARKVGREGASVDTEVVGDELSTIATVLSESHARILADRVELVRRHEALEQHLAGIAHDLRTPLSSMQLSLEALAADTRSAGAALQDAVYLSTLVENLHQGVRLRHGTATAGGTVDLTALVTRLGTRFEVIGRAAGIEVAAHTPEHPVYTDCAPALAERAIANLVHNAVRHNQPGGHVAVLLEVDETTFQVRILDDGPGIPEAIRHRLEDPTFRTDLARTRGTGLGLLISREIAERAGWTLAWNTPEDGGTEAVVSGRMDYLRASKSMM